MQAKFTTKDLLTPALAKKAAAIQNMTPVMEAAGLQLVSLTKRAFQDSSLRPSPWADRKKAVSWSLLRKSGALWQSIRIVALGKSKVTVGTDRRYAATHQLGSAKKNIPARPFFPFINGKMTPKARNSVLSVIRAKMDNLLK